MIRKLAILAFGVLANLFGLPFEAVPGAPAPSVREAFAEVLAGVQELLRRNFPSATAFVEEPKTLTDEQMARVENEAKLTLHPAVDRHFVFYAAKSGDGVLGYAVEDYVPGKWGPIHYLLTLDPQGVVRDVSVLEYRERRGRPVAKTRFTRQFIGKKKGDPLAVQKDIQGVTGASISSKGVTNGIRKLVYIFELFYAAK